MVAELHKLFNNLPRHSFPMAEGATIPDNGLYLLFEKGERLSFYDRIVQVETHTKAGVLPTRMSQHFVEEDKNSSIFRKHIGGALLAEEDHPYYWRWELNVTSPADRENNLPLIDEEFEKSIERRVTAYIQDSFTYCTVPMEKKEDRKHWQGKIVATLAQVENILPSEDWLGHYATSPSIRGSGLWNVRGLKGEPLTTDELAELERLARG